MHAGQILSYQSTWFLNCSNFKVTPAGVIYTHFKINTEKIQIYRLLYSFLLLSFRRLLLCHILQKVPGEEVIADVASTVNQSPFRFSESRRLQLDLAVLHHLGDPSHSADHAHWLSRVRLLNHLSSTKAHNITNKRSHLYKNNRERRDFLSHQRPTYMKLQADWCTFIVIN